MIRQKAACNGILDSYYTGERSIVVQCIKEIREGIEFHNIYFLTACGEILACRSIVEASGDALNRYFTPVDRL